MKVRRIAMLIIASLIPMVDAGTATAFYWRNWPGSGLGTTTATTTTSSVTNSSQPVAVPDAIVVLDPIDEPDPVDPGTHAPEPATIVGGLIGLGLLAGMRMRRLIESRGSVNVARTSQSML